MCGFGFSYKTCSSELATFLLRPIDTPFEGDLKHYWGLGVHHPHRGVYSALVLCRNCSLAFTTLAVCAEGGMHPAANCVWCGHESRAARDVLRGALWRFLLKPL